ncbi:NACHT LRR PYD domain-containing protein [Fusarium pseudocircinatum]|uniref:NACHT LRR PYD domain-containing protein n=1 Tax=Fusarium pseudocircinatum TaxID=56676 RepID=A0A8H5L8M8_9HYPO|nr:NACHT LRR PYD domain-containing protein [Fusarium pseudocircinatum]
MVNLSLKESGQYVELLEESPETQRLTTPGLKDNLAYLKAADDWLLQRCYCKENLEIERLSGERLPLEQCYINLMVIPHARNQTSRLSNLTPNNKITNLSLFRRLNVQGPDGGVRVKFHDIFNAARAQGAASKHSTRILIRGQAGVGKTTFCKKAVHDFVQNQVWRQHFDRILWVRLRNLLSRDGGHNLKELFCDEFFSQHPKCSELAGALQDACTDPAGGKTLFLLDGLDEVWHLVQPGDDLAQFVIYLLNQPNVLALSRPSVPIRSSIQPFDLELEMIGFGTDQVHEYVKHMEPERHEEIQTFLSSRPLIQDLVRIPIQLDALCYGWDQVHNQGPETMTDLYQSIEKGLWSKDVVRLGKSKIRDALTEKDKGFAMDIEELIEDETRFIELLAFTGLCNNIVEFQEKHVNIICRYTSTHSTFVNNTLPKLSFLRTSDSSVGKSSRTYHFLHLTLQEYFAARYFVRIWLQHNNADLVCIKFNPNAKWYARASSHTVTKTKDFLSQNKYSSRYNIMWRFVTGLLYSGRNGSDELALQFLQAIDSEPLDLIGVAHQRLAMHCLAELRPSTSSERVKAHRSHLEAHLVRWVTFQAQSRKLQEGSLAGETEFPSKALLMMLQNEDPVTFRAALMAYKKRMRSGSRALPEFEHVLTCRLRNVGSEKTQKYGGPLLENDVSMIIKSLGPPEYWTESVNLALSLSLENQNPWVASGILSALNDYPDIIATYIESISTVLDSDDASLRWRTIVRLSGQKNLPQSTLDRMARFLYRSEESRVARERVLDILTAESYWEKYLTLKATEDEGGEKRRDYVDLVQTGLELMEYEDPENVAIATLALGCQDQQLPRKAVNKILMNLPRNDVVIRLASLDALARQTNLEIEDLRAIADHLDNPIRVVQLATVKVLEGRSELSRMDDTLCSLVRFLRVGPLDIDSEIRLVAERILRCQEFLSERVVEAMICLFNDETTTPKGHQKPLFIPGGFSDVMPPFPEAALNKTIPYLRSQYQKIRRGALLLFDGQSKLPETVLRAIIECLVDDYEPIRRQAMNTLESHRLDLNERLYSAIESHVDFKDEAKRDLVFQTVYRTARCPETVLRTIEKALHDKDHLIRLNALTYWIHHPEIPGRLHEAVAACCEALTHREPKGRHCMIKMLTRENKRFLPDNRTLYALAEFLSDDDVYIRRDTVSYLSRHPNVPPKITARIFHKMTAFPEDIFQYNSSAILLQHNDAYGAALARAKVDEQVKFLLERSDTMHIAWYTRDGQSLIETGSGVMCRELEDPRAFVSAVEKARKKAEMPDVVATDGL